MTKYIDKTMNENENKNENIDSEINDEQADKEKSGDEGANEELKNLKKKVATLEAQKEHWRNKASKTDNKKDDKKQEVEFSQSDLLAIVRNNVSDEDIDTVKKFANVNGVDVSTALKDDVLKSILSDREEKRKSANVTNTGNARKSNSKPSDEIILSNANEGKLPDNVNDLVEARFRAKMGRK